MEETKTTKKMENKKRKEPQLKDILPIFFQRKIIELFYASPVILAIIIILIMVGPLICSKNYYDPDVEGFCNNAFSNTFAHEGTSSPLGYWMAGVLPVMIGVLVILSLVILIYKWIKSNWEKSYDEAYEELNGY